MADTVKIIGTEITLTTANTVANSSVVRLVNLDSANSVLITQKSNSTTTVATFTLGHHGTDFGKLYIIKQPTHTLDVTGTTVANGIKAAPCAFY